MKKDYYEILGVPFPGWDEKTLSEKLVFKRENNKLIVNISSNSDESNNVELIIPQDVALSVTMLDAEAGDDWELEETRRTNYLLSFNCVTQGTDYDDYEVSLSNSHPYIIFFNESSIPMNKSVVGTTYLTGSCGATRDLLKK